MKLRSLAFALVLCVAMTATAMAANDTATGKNMTPVSVFQNATVYVNTTTAGIARIGAFDNGSVYVNGGANATVVGPELVVNLGAAPEMGYRDVYIFYRLPPGFNNVSFDYDLLAGEKSNVLLVDFYDDLPKSGLRKGGVPDRSIVGTGTWTAMYSQIGGLTSFPQGTHHVELFPSNTMMFMKVDGNITTFGEFTQRKYLVIHLMTGDGDSYLKGSLSNLHYAGPSLDAINLNDTGNKSPFLFPNGSGAATNGSGSATAVSHAVSVTPKPDPTTEAGSSRPGSINIWFVLALAAGFFIAWGIVYFKYLNK